MWLDTSYEPSKTVNVHCVTEESQVLNDLAVDPVNLIDRRNEIMLRIHERVDVVDTGFVLDGKASPCHLWTGPTSGEGRGGGYGRMSLNSQTVAVHLVVYDCCRWRTLARRT